MGTESRLDDDVDADTDRVRAADASDATDPSAATHELRVGPHQWRYACPNGHTGGEIRPRRDGFYCRQCDRRGWERSPYFDRLRDKRTGDAVGRDEVVVDP